MTLEFSELGRTMGNQSEFRPIPDSDIFVPKQIIRHRKHFSFPQVRPPNKNLLSDFLASDVFRLPSLPAIWQCNDHCLVLTCLLENTDTRMFEMSSVR